MQKPLQFYTEEKSALESEYAALKNKSSTLSLFRFLVFLATAIGIYLTFGAYIKVGLIAFVGIVLFGYLLIKHSEIDRKNKIVAAKIKINSTEIAVLNGNYAALPTGSEFINARHFYSSDIDLFGPGSFFQYTNRTVTEDGSKEFAKTLTDNTIDEIEEKQAAIKDLASKTYWRQHFSAIASSVKVQHSTNTIVAYIQNYSTVLPKQLPLFTKLFSLTSILLFVLAVFKIIPFVLLVIWFFVGLMITALFIKRTQNIYTNASKAKETFKQYYLLLQEIERTSFTSSILKQQQQIIQSENTKASVIFGRFSKILDAFDQRNNDIIAFLGNAYFLWDMQNASKVENWIAKYKHTVAKWFEVIAFFDAQNSLANFSYNHPTFVLPTINTSKSLIKASALGHPLLPAEKRIANDFQINEQQFYIVTGANMAGKSTFLRTVSLTLVMANIGLPVCASAFEYTPIKLITSMRTSDSLAEDESYFYSELKRLKQIVDTIETANYFIVLDEILKGTNSKDKAIGSKKFIEKLNQTQSTGIIATHDVSLCILEEEFSTIENYYFDAEIIDDELFFDYTFKKGICKNMNASFLLKKMKIV